jgi:hypothetical protein
MGPQESGRLTATKLLMDGRSSERYCFHLALQEEVFVVMDLVECF